MSTLHITNGDSVVQSFREAQLSGKYLSWIDILYDGPVPVGTLDDLSPIRAKYFANLDQDTSGRALHLFRSRDETLKSFHRYDEVVLWFEHDLTDQLQLIQLLDWFSNRDLGDTLLALINIGVFPGVTPFHGLGQLTGDQLLQLWPTRKRISAEQLSLGRDAWQAFSAGEPTKLLELMDRDLSALPFLANALQRFFQEYPSTHDGLSRTERQILSAVASGAQTRKAIFVRTQETESPRFMGDVSVYSRLERLVAPPVPAVERLAENTYELSTAGRELLAGNADWIQYRSGIDTWLGGVHLQGQEHLWRWDEKAQSLIAV